MSAKKKIVAPHKALVSMDKPTHLASPEELVVVTKQQLDRIKQAADYPNQAAVQAAVTTLAASSDGLQKTLSAIDANRAEFDALLATRALDITGITRDRGTLRAALNAVAKGSADTIRAWNCAVQTKTATPANTEAPAHLVVKNSTTTPGTVQAKCKGVRGAASYTFAFTPDPNAAAGSGQLVSSTKSRCELAGQPVGHLVYARVAVTRRGGGQSVWSEPAQLMVR